MTRPVRHRFQNLASLRVCVNVIPSVVILILAYSRHRHFYCSAHSKLNYCISLPKYQTTSNICRTLLHIQLLKLLIIIKPFIFSYWLKIKERIEYKLKLWRQQQVDPCTLFPLQQANTSFKAYYLACSVMTKSHVPYVMSACLVTRILQQCTQTRYYTKEWTKYDQNSVCGASQG